MSLSRSWMMLTHFSSRTWTACQGILSVWAIGGFGDDVGIYREGNGGSDGTRGRKRTTKAVQLVLHLLHTPESSLLVCILRVEDLTV